MKNINSFLFSALLITLPCATAMAGNVYKWIDDQGVVHYTDQKPSERQAETLSVKTTPSTPGAPATIDDPNAAVENLKRQQEIETLGKRQIAEASQEAQQKKELCDNARANLEVIQNNARVKVEDNGSQRFLTPEEIVQKRDEYQKAVSDYC